MELRAVAEKPTDIDLLKTLTLQVRFLSCEQVARGWFGGKHIEALGEARARLASLQSRGLIAHTTIEFRSGGAIKAPIFAWSPGEPDPEFEHYETLAARLTSRWAPRLTPVEVFFAAPRAANLFGVSPLGPSRPCEWSHDYRVSEVYLHYRMMRTAASRRWQGEAARPKWGRRIARMKDPDAVLRDPAGAIERVVEIGGKYSAMHLEAFHNHCAGEAFDRFELWRMRKAAADTDNPYQREQVGYEIW